MKFFIFSVIILNVISIISIDMAIVIIRVINDECETFNENDCNSTINCRWDKHSCLTNSGLYALICTFGVPTLVSIISTSIIIGYVTIVTLYRKLVNYYKYRYPIDILNDDETKIIKVNTERSLLL